jgi:hypothetical protein
MGTESRMDRCQDEMITVTITTPGGLNLPLDPDHIPVDSVREHIRNGTDVGAANVLANLTGCAITIERKFLTTVRPKA